MGIQRVPIKIERKAIKLKAFQTYRKKLLELCDSFVDTKDFLVLDVIKHYEMLARDFLGTPYYEALGKKGKNHKNWKIFVKLFDICVTNGYDCKMYMEAQFYKAAKYWTKNRYPLPHMMLGEKAKKYYEHYINNEHEKYSKDIRREDKIKPKETETLQGKVLKAIADSANKLKYYMSKVKGEPKFVKVYTIYNFWSNLSHYYLYSVPWFREYAGEVLSEDSEQRLLKYMVEEFEKIDKSEYLQNLILQGVKIAEQELDISENIGL